MSALLVAMGCLGALLAVYAVLRAIGFEDDEGW